MAKKLHLPSTIHISGIGRRTFAFLLDLIFILAGIFAVYYALGRPAILNNNGYQETVASRKAYIEAPELLEYKDGRYNYILLNAYNEETKVYGYETYSKQVWEYFTVFLPAHADYAFIPPKFVKSQGEKITTIQESDRNNPKVVGQWTYENFFKSDYFVAAVDEKGDPDYTKQPVLSEMASKIGADGLLEQRTNLRDFFANSTKGSGSYVDAVENLITQQTIADYDNAILYKQWAAYVPSIAISPLLFLLLIPMLLPHGKTLGKLILRLGIISEEGYAAKKSSLLIRQGLISLLFAVLLIPYLYAALMIFLFTSILFYMSMVLSKSGQGFQDKLARTIVINTKTSIWFASEEDQREYADSHPNSLVAQALNNDESKKTYFHTKEDYGVFDSSMIGEARKKAEVIESFDDFEKSEEQLAKERAEAAAKAAESKAKAEAEAKKAKQEAAKARQEEALHEQASSASILNGVETKEEPSQTPDQEGFTDE